MSNNEVDDLGRMSTVIRSGWRIEKNISVGVIITLLLHTGAIVWFLANLNAGLANLKQSNIAMQQRVTILSDKIDSMMSSDEIMRLHNYAMDRINNIDSRVRDLEKIEYQKK